MEKNFKNKNVELAFLILLILLGFYFRYLNLFFEDYWIDEMLSFENADPNISFLKTLERVESSERTPALFFLTLKYFFKFFQYHPDVGRIYILILGTLTIPVAFLLSKELKANSSAILFSFFICTNIYLINYSQEVRVYTLLFLIALLNIFLFLKVINESENKKNFFTFSCLLFVVNILGFSAHPFFLIILVSEISYCLIKIILKEKKIFTILLILLLSLIVSILIEYNYLLSLKADENVNWIKSSDYLNTKFFTDFYFRKFFGSKIMGAIYFFTLATLIFNMRKKIFFSSNYLILILIIFFSYFIPILYGFVKLPVLYDRYIIFVLIPIFALISALVYELKNPKIKKIVISILVITTLSNLYLEIGNKNYHHKPLTTKILSSITEISSNQNPINIYIDQQNGIPTFYNYVIKLDEFNKNNFNIIEKNEISSVDNFWAICYVDVCLSGICYKDLPEENLGTEIPGWPINLCSNIKEANNKFKVIKVIGKRSNPHHKVIGKLYAK